MVRIVSVALALGLFLLAERSLACGTPADGVAFTKQIGPRLRCEHRAALGAAIACGSQSDVCADQQARVAELVFGGDGGGPVTNAGRRCQRAIASAARKFLRRRVRELLGEGRRAQSWAHGFLARVARACPATSSGSALPRVGAECSAFAHPLQREGAGFCLRGALEAVAQEVSGVAVRPNVLLLLTDDQRWDTLWAMPLTRERVAARGVEFDESFTSTSLCCPDRASILTGLYAHNHGVLSNAGAHSFDHERDTIARQLKENAGYRTALLGKYMVNTGAALGSSVPPGWDVWKVFTQNGNDGSGRLYYNYTLNENGTARFYGSEPQNYSTDVLRNRALALVAQWRDEPWFIEVAFYAPHAEAFPAPRHAGSFAGLAPHRPPNHREADVSDKPRWVSDQAYVAAFGGGEPGQTDARRIAQLATLPAVDEAVAALADALEASGLADNTLLLFTSDNGYMWLEHWLRLKNYPYEESLRVPLLIRYPKLAPAPRISAELVQPIDFYPTFVELAGIPGEQVNGRSLVPLLRGDATGWRDTILIEHFHHVGGIDPSAGVRTHRWKLIETDASQGVTTELYDLLADPYELENVAGDPANAEVLADLRLRLAALRLE